MLGARKREGWGFQLQAGRKNIHRARQAGLSTVGALGCAGWCKQRSAQEGLVNETWAVCGNSLAVQRSGLGALNAGVLGQGTEISQAARHGQKTKLLKKKKKSWAVWSPLLLINHIVKTLNGTPVGEGYGRVNIWKDSSTIVIISKLGNA